VNRYLSGILPGLTAKVFRTHHATVAVRESLETSAIKADSPEYAKWKAANLANLEAAILCNHTKKAPASWPRSRQRYKERRLKAGERVKTYRERVKTYREALVALRKEAREKRQAASPKTRAKVKARYDKRIGVAERRLERAQGMLGRARLARGKVDAQAIIAAKKRTWNLGTSLKSYIDPRVYHRWGQQVEYDVIDRYYPKALRQKFGWARNEEYDSSTEVECGAAEVRDEPQEVREGPA
jgi:DNA topoisomerase-1